MQRIWLTEAPSNSSIEKVVEVAASRDVLAPAVPIRYMNVEALSEPHLRFLFEQDVRTVEPAVEVYRLEDALVLANGVIATLDGYVLNDSFGPYTRAHDLNAEFGDPESNTFTRILPEGDARIGFRALEKRTGPYFNLRDHGEFGYFHFMNAVMPSAAVWRDKFPDVPCYFASGTDFHKHYFEMVGLRGAGHFVARGATTLFRELFVVAGMVRPDWFSGGFFERPRYAVHSLRQLANGIRPGERRRIYISRRDTSVRPINNEQALEDMIERELNFTPVRMTNLTAIQQVELFKGCEAVIGLHGAGLSNIVFCQPGARIIELFPPSRIWPTFRALANRCELHYCAIILDSETEIDVEKLRELLVEVI